MSRTPTHRFTKSPFYHGLLLALDGRRGWHFPQDEDGVYAGYYPKDSTTAIAHLERLRGKGADYLLFPEPALWWLTYYDGLRAYLQDRYEPIADGGGGGVLVKLHTPKQGRGRQSIVLPPSGGDKSGVAETEHEPIQEPSLWRAFQIRDRTRPRRCRKQLPGKLWAVTTYFNPAGYRNKLNNHRRFRAELARVGVPLLAMELAFGAQRFSLRRTDADALVRLRGQDVLWQKERLLNLSLRHLPDDCDKVAWLDGDVLFVNPAWPEETSRLLEQHPVVQPYSHCVRLLRDEFSCDPLTLPFGMNERQLFYGMGFGVFAKGRSRLKDYFTSGHTGFAWAARRSLLEKHGFYDANLFCHGDYDMASAMYQNLNYWSMEKFGPRGKAHVRRWARPFGADVKGRVAFVDGFLLHLWHGNLKDRLYDLHVDGSRDFDPDHHLAVDAETGLYRWTESTPERMRRWSADYYAVRKEGATPESGTGEPRVKESHASTRRALGRMTVVEPSLTTPSGHHLNCTLGLLAAARDAGLETAVYTGASATDAVLRDVDGKPTFSANVYTHQLHANQRELGTQSPGNSHFARQLEPIAVGTPKGHDVVVFPTVTHGELLGIASWLSRMPRGERPSIIIWLLFDEKFLAHDLERQKAARRAYIEGFRALFAVAPAAYRWCLVAETPAMADYHSQLAEQPVRVLRMPNTVRGVSSAGRRERSSYNAVDIICAGYVTKEKGYHLLPKIIAEVCASSSRARFVVHADWEGGPEPPSTVRALKDLGSKVTLLEGPMQPAAFHELLGRGDIGLLPYDPIAYRRRGSAVFHEVEALGIPIVAPGDADFASEAISHGHCLGFDEFSAPSIAATVLDAISRLSELTSAAIQRAATNADRFVEVEKLLTEMAVNQEMHPSAAVIVSSARSTST